VNDAASLVREEASDEANIIFGTVIDETLGDELKVTGGCDRVRAGASRRGRGGTAEGDQACQPADDLQTPAFLRASAPKTFENAWRPPLIDKEAEIETLDEFEIPTFLRRRWSSRRKEVVGRPHRGATGPQTRSSPAARIGESEFA